MTTKRKRPAKAKTKAKTGPDNVVPIGPKGGRQRRGQTVRAASKRASELEEKLAETVAELEELRAEVEGGLDRETLGELLRLTREDIAQLRRIRQRPGRNALAQIRALELSLAYAYGRPRQEIDLGGRGVNVRHVVEIVEVEPETEDDGQTPSS